MSVFVDGLDSIEEVVKIDAMDWIASIGLLRRIQNDAAAGSDIILKDKETLYIFILNLMATDIISVCRILYLDADLTMKADFLSKYVLRTATN